MTSLPKKPRKESSSFYDWLLVRIPYLGRLQDRIITLGCHRTARLWLGLVAFSESIIFPIPVDPMLAAMVLARPRQFISLAVLTTLASTLGGVVGWLIGAMLGDAAMIWLEGSKNFTQVKAAFVQHGWLFILIGAFTPLPYKIITLSSGFLGIGVAALIFASLVGRGFRFFLVAAIIRYRGDNRIAAMLSFLLVGLFISFWWFGVA